MRYNIINQERIHNFQIIFFQNSIGTPDQKHVIH